MKKIFLFFIAFIAFSQFAQAQLVVENQGNTCMTGMLTTGSVVNPSDYRLKKNIEALAPGTLDDILQMNVVSFDYKQREIESNDTCTQYFFEEDSPILTHKHYGLIAQELQEIYPDLVLEGGDGYLSVNYIELIPLLIHSVQELSARLEATENLKAPHAEGTTGAASEVLTQTILYQNTPNPFTETTTISLTVAEGVTLAILYIYDLNGKQIADYPVTERGNTSVVIEGRRLEAGMYLYSLIADGNVIDTKRMILTK
jgi:hypothetical protein